MAHAAGSFRQLAAMLAVLAVAAAVRAEAEFAEAPPEPSGYRQNDYRSPTPATLQGATVVSGAEAMALWKAGAARFIDVMPRPRKPDNLPPQILWHVPDRQTIPGSLWLPNTGYGVLNPAAAAYFRDKLEQASKGDLAAPLLFFCLRDCWMSWNAAKRALELGYRRVIWFPDGIEGWTAIGGTLAPTPPVEPTP